MTPSGKTVASLLQTQDPAAIAISQGGAAGAPGSPGAGSISLYQAVKLASEQPQESSAEKVYNARNGAQYYMFGAPGSAACQIARARSIRQRWSGHTACSPGPTTTCRT